MAKIEISDNLIARCPQDRPLIETISTALDLYLSAIERSRITARDRATVAIVDFLKSKSRSSKKEILDHCLGLGIGVMAQKAAKKHLVKVGLAVYERQGNDFWMRWVERQGNDCWTRWV